MTRILLNGCNGKMGRAVTAYVDACDDIEIVAGVDVEPIMLSHYPVFTDPFDVTCTADVLIDFSNPAALPRLLLYIQQEKLPAVVATTGLSQSDIDAIEQTSRLAPIFFTFNMSLGVNLLLDLARKAVAVLGPSFDIEIIERHHNTKIDAPSGTALMIANALNDVLGQKMTFEYDRHAKRAARSKNEIGIHSVRGGTIVGEHEVLFAGHDEQISITHRASSKEVFAVGAVNAAVFLAGGLPAGIYQMQDLVASK